MPWIYETAIGFNSAIQPEKLLNGESDMSDCQSHNEPSKPTSYMSERSTSLPTFVGDGWVAAQIGMKISTIRVQRFNRRHGRPHWLDIDPVFIGSKPRWRRADVVAWLKKQSYVEVTQP